MTTELPPRFEPPVSTRTEQPLPENITDFAGWRAWLGPRPMIAMNTLVNGDEVQYPQPGPANTAWLAHDLLNHAEAQAARIATLEAEVAEWRRLRDPATLHVNLLRGIPAKLPREVFLHIAGDDPQADRIATLEAALESERKRCATIARSLIANATDWDSSYWDQACERVALEIENGAALAK